MSWDKLKNIMIALLLLVNAVLLITLYRVETDNTTLSKETVANAVQVLKEHGITIDPSLIPQKNEMMGTLPLVAGVTDAKQVAETFLGKEYTHRKEKDTGIEAFDKGKKTVRINGGYLRYSGGRDISGVPGEEIWTKAKETLQRAGISLADAKEFKKGNNEYIFCQQCEGRPFFDGQISVIADRKGIVSAEGFWMVPNGAVTASEEVRPITEIFAQFIQDENRSEESTEITGIRLGYSVRLGDESITFSEATAIPTWEITTSDGKHYYYSARR